MASGGGIALLIGVVVGGVALVAGSGSAKASPDPNPKPNPNPGGSSPFDQGFQDGFSACNGGTDGTFDSAKANASGDPGAYVDGWNAGCTGSQTKSTTDDLLPGTTTKKSRVRAIDKDTGTPSQFAQKYSGTAARWTEIPGANPSGTIYPGSPAIISKTIFTLNVDPNTGETLADGQNVTGLQPWMLGQLVKLPDSWTG